jgi:hypothetical protein
MQEKITLLYSCHDCTLVKVPCEVPVRQEESVTDWMSKVILWLCEDHAKRSPGCHPKMLHDVMIPIEGVDKIGGGPVN